MFHIEFVYAIKLIAEVQLFGFFQQQRRSGQRDLRFIGVSGQSSKEKHSGQSQRSICGRRIYETSRRDKSVCIIEVGDQRGE